MNPSANVHNVDGLSMFQMSLQHFQEKAKDRINSLLDRSHVVVIVSHDLGALRQLCTRGIAMKRGRVVGDGPIDAVIDQYLEEIALAPAG